MFDVQKVFFKFASEAEVITEYNIECESGIIHVFGTALIPKKEVGGLFNKLFGGK